MSTSTQFKIHGLMHQSQYNRTEYTNTHQLKCINDVVEAHCYFVDIGRTDCGQIRSRINNNDCRTLWPRRPLSTAYKMLLLILLRNCSRSVRPIKYIILYVLYVYTKINSHTEFQHCTCRVRPHLSDLLYFLSLCTLTARAQMTLPHTTTMSRTAAPRIPYTIFDVSSLAVAKAVRGVGIETSVSVQMTCIHYMPSPLDSVVA